LAARVRVGAPSCGGSEDAEAGVGAEGLVEGEGLVGVGAAVRAAKKLTQDMWHSRPRLCRRRHPHPSPLPEGEGKGAQPGAAVPQH